MKSIYAAVGLLVVCFLIGIAASSLFGFSSRRPETLKPVVEPVVSALPEPLPEPKDPKEEPIIWGLTKKQFDEVNARKNAAVRSCEDSGHIATMGYGWDVICIEGNVKVYNAETGETRKSRSYR